MATLNRKQLEALVWKHTHRDYRGKIDGKRNIMGMDPKTGGSCLVFLHQMTEEELIEALPSKIRAGLRLTWTDGEVNRGEG